MAGMVSTSQHCSLLLGHLVQAAYGTTQMGPCWLWLVSADTFVPKQQVEPLLQRNWQEKGAWSEP